MDQKLKPANLIAQTRERFDALSNREQRMLLIAAAVGALAVVWLVAIEPAIKALTETRRSLPDKQAQASRILAVANTVAALRERGGSRGQAASAPAEVLQSRIALMQWTEKSTFEDRGDGSFMVEITGVPAADALDWLDNTERLSGLTLQNLTMDKVSTGTVNLRSIWGRPAGSGGNSP